MTAEIGQGEEPTEEAVSALAAADPSALRAAEDRIAALEARLAGQARARSELVHLVSHELRTPITVISGFTRLIQNENHGSLSTEQNRFAQEILRACCRLDDFVVDLLEASPAEDTPFAIERRPANLHESLTAQLESLAPLLGERNIKVEAKLSAADPKLSFDERRMEQVITNLMTNAIRYGRPAGVIRISTATRSSSSVGSDLEYLEVSIEDDGPGIPEADRERLFEPYVRGENGVDTGGLGIGLAISRRIIRSHGGRIWVEASEFGGARFVFSLPCVDSTEEEDGFDAVR